MSVNCFLLLYNYYLLVLRCVHLNEKGKTTTYIYVIYINSTFRYIYSSSVLISTLLKGNSRNVTIPTTRHEYNLWLIVLCQTRIEYIQARVLFIQVHLTEMMPQQTVDVIKLFTHTHTYAHTCERHVRICSHFLYIHIYTCIFTFLSIYAIHVQSHICIQFQTRFLYTHTHKTDAYQKR